MRGPERRAQMTGGVHRTIQNLRDCIQAGLTGRADPKRRINSVGRIIQKISFYLIGKVEEDDYLLKGSVVLFLLDAFQQFDFLRRQLQIIAVGGVPCRTIHIIQRTQRTVAAGHITAFAAHTGNDDNGSITVGGKACAVGTLHFAPRRFANDLDALDAAAGFAHHALVTCLILRGIPVPKTFVDLKIVIALKGRLEGRCRGRIDCTGTRTSIDGIHTADAEQAHLALRGCQRQRVIVIFQQNDTLGHGLFAQHTTCTHQRVQIVIAGFEILGVRAVIACCNRTEVWRVQRRIDLRCVFIGDNATRITEPAQYRHYQCHRLAQRRARFY